MKYVATVLLLMIFHYSWMAKAQFKTVKEVYGKSVGQTVTNFTALDANGNAFYLNQALEEGPVVLLFYRGQWCPVCNRHLSELQDELKNIESKGVQVVAVSPERQQNLNKTQSKTGAQFRLLHDKDYKISEDFDVAFVPKKQLIQLYDSRLQADLKNAHSDTSQRIPVPATFIINKKGVVAWRHFDRNYKERASAKDIIEALDKM